MSTQTDPKPAPAAEPARQRKTLSLSDEVVELGERLAREENRNFSNYVETLILRDGGKLAAEDRKEEAA